MLWARSFGVVGGLTLFAGQRLHAGAFSPTFVPAEKPTRPHTYLSALSKDDLNQIGNLFEEKLAATVNRIEAQVNRIDARTGYLVEESVVRKLNDIQGDHISKFKLRTSGDLVDVLKAKDDRQRQVWTKLIDEHLYRNCTRDLLKKIDPNTAVDDHRQLAWEQHAYITLQKKAMQIAERSYSEDNGVSKDQTIAEREVVKSFMKLIEAGGMGDDWNNGRETHSAKKFDHAAAKACLGEHNGLASSLMAADGNLDEWSYSKEWAFFSIDFGFIKARDKHGWIELVEVKSSMGGKKKSSSQLKFRSHLLDKYANIAWSSVEQKKPELNIEMASYVYDLT